MITNLYSKEKTIANTLYKQFGDFVKFKNGFVFGMIWQIRK
jgi:hypothetical protein